MTARSHRSVSATWEIWLREEKYNVCTGTKSIENPRLQALMMISDSISKRRHPHGAALTQAAEYVLKPH
jgi:hypothetical protein